MAHPLDPLLADGIIEEVIGRLKSGKEADIYRVRRGGEVIAAKVYKDRATRSFKSNADYKEGRGVRSSRTQRAIDSGSRFGRQAEEDAWKSAEADALRRLYAAGLRVPKPEMFYEGVLLMHMVSDKDGNAAPRLNDLAFTQLEAFALYLELRRQIIGMLCLDLIHGDLSPFNILAGAEGVVIIDFPQVVSAPHSSRAEWFFRRDFESVRLFLAGFDERLRGFSDDAHKIWSAYVRRELSPSFEPTPPSSPGRRDPRGRRGGRGPGRAPHERGPQRLPPARALEPASAAPVRVESFTIGAPPRSSSRPGDTSPKPGSNGPRRRRPRRRG
ncbi:MAG: hypothetical protein IPL79_10960 [Myxococcales bacterium]|nr:hypothetical protein [Myxococcales bacterium]